jgi:UDP-glucose 4-epimerase
MKVLITGISGYISSVFTPRLLEDDEVEEVHGIDLQYPKSLSTTNLKLKFIEEDIRAPDIVVFLSGIDVLFHFAFIVTPNVSYQELDSINIEGSKNVFNAAAKARVKHIFFASSIAAYGADSTHSLPLKEDSPLKPNQDWYYSRAKGAMEKYLDDFEQEYPDIKVTRFRPAILLGPNINNPFGSILKSRLIVDFGYDTKIEWVWDEDVADAIYLAFKKGETGIYNIGGDNPLSFKEIAKLTP